MEKLTKIQNELKAPKNQYNSFGKYKYRSCEDILEAIKPLLEKHKCTLTITDEIKQINDIIFVEATVNIFDLNGSGRTVKAQAGITPNKKGMDLSQSFGSSSSYARKYALNGLFLIDDTKDADTRDNSKNTIEKPELLKDSKIWNIAVEKIKAGETTVEKVLSHYKLSPEDLIVFKMVKPKENARIEEYIENCTSINDLNIIKDDLASAEQKELFSKKEKELNK